MGCPPSPECHACLERCLLLYIHIFPRGESPTQCCGRCLVWNLMSAAPARCPLVTMKMVLPMPQPLKDLACHSEHPLLLHDWMLLAERERKKDSNFFLFSDKMQGTFGKAFPGDQKLHSQHRVALAAAQQPHPAAHWSSQHCEAGREADVGRAKSVILTRTSG